jgi:hypothetical protein
VVFSHGGGKIQVWGSMDIVIVVDVNASDIDCFHEDSFDAEATSAAF